MLQKTLSLSLAVVALIATSNLARAEQTIIQSGSATASAEGENSFAASRVNQSARQNRIRGNQTILQQGSVNSSARGQNNAVTGHIRQSAEQNQVNPNNSQRATQNASGDYVGVGNNNTIQGSSEQRSIQTQQQ